MKSLTKVFIALLLSVTIAFGSFNTRANSSPISYVDHNQVSSSDIQPQILPNQTIEMPIMTITYKSIVEIANKTKCILRPVGVYNHSLEWPLGDIDSLQLVGERFNSDTFSFASNYQIDCGISKEKINLQFSTSLGTEGNQKINIGVINQDGNQPAKSTWDEMTDPSDKSLNNSPFQVNAFIRQKDQASIWLFEVTEK
ncbi:hypothetical protein OGM63_21860 [Plectonema radiosum NIES-515]|uniref:Uncharacterized protein n=1 Tax=Plectonema radiosum NIES-515 TaxID=2986073 RepID=A0ABT3B427_9CYAN|nr:hypothetical protein [Plectonema radiosum]MCV3216123.1 hypothetical protein [Plectonema radiosum NIES-515]